MIIVNPVQQNICHLKGEGVIDDMMFQVDNVIQSVSPFGWSLGSLQEKWSDHKSGKGVNLSGSEQMF